MRDEYAELNEHVGNHYVAHGSLAMILRFLRLVRTLLAFWLRRWTACTCPQLFMMPCFPEHCAVLEGYCTTCLAWKAILPLKVLDTRVQRLGSAHSDVHVQPRMRWAGCT
jgi:hypothetical protein